MGANSVKKAACITKRLKSSDNILSTLTKIQSDTKSMDTYTESTLRDILTLSSNTLKDTLLQLGGNIIDLPNLKNHTSEVEIVQR